MSLTRQPIAERQAVQGDALHHGLLPLHASAVICNGSGVLIGSSRPHAGKTGVLLALMAAGARFVGDDCVCLSPDGRILGVERPLEIRCEYLRQLPQYRQRLTARQRMRCLSLGLLERCIAAPGSGETASETAWRRSRRRLTQAIARRARVRTDARRLFGADACAGDAPLDVIVLTECHDRPEIVVEPADPRHVARSLTTGLEQGLRPPARLLAEKPAFVLRHPPGATLAELREALSPVIQSGTGRKRRLEPISCPLPNTTMTSLMRGDEPVDLDRIRDGLRRSRAAEGDGPAASVVIPVNAQGDLKNVLRVLGDLARYQGPHALEIILVINNYDPADPPREIEDYRGLGVRTLGVSSVRRPGEAVGFSARIPGVREARSEAVLLFDADCRIPQPAALVDWYVEQFRSGAEAAYTHVGYCDFMPCPSVRLRLCLHHAARWVKRNVLRIPTTRGSNYAVRRETMLRLYERLLLADEMNVGPTFKRLAGRVAYSGRSELAVLTSGRMFRPGWKRILPYFLYRLRYNLRVLPVRNDVARRTGRERDPVRRYVDNRPVRP